MPVAHHIGNAVLRGHGLYLQCAHQVVAGGGQQLEFVVGAAAAPAREALAGVGLGQAWDAIKGYRGNAVVHETRGQRILNGRYDSAVTNALAQKDLGFALDFGRKFGVPLKLASMTAQIFIEGKQAFGGDAQSPSIVKLLEDELKTDLRAPGFPAKLI